MSLWQAILTVFLAHLILQCVVDGFKGQKAFETEGILSDLGIEPPKYPLKVIYSDKIFANFGNELTPTQVKVIPLVDWKHNKKGYYTLIMLDLDAPSRANPTLRSVNHWLVGNIKGNNVECGDIIAQYRGSGPPKEGGVHRYVLLVYKQTGRKFFDEPRTRNNSRANRLKFPFANFIEKYNLSGPLAGNFFKARWDPYVIERDANDVE